MRSTDSIGEMQISKLTPQLMANQCMASSFLTEAATVEAKNFARTQLNVIGARISQPQLMARRPHHINVLVAAASSCSKLPEEWHTLFACLILSEHWADAACCACNPAQERVLLIKLSRQKERRGQSKHPSDPRGGLLQWKQAGTKCVKHRHYLEVLGKKRKLLTVLTTPISHLITLILLCAVPGLPRAEFDSLFLLFGDRCASVRALTWHVEALNLYTSFSISELLVPKVVFHAAGILVGSTVEGQRNSDDALNVATFKKWFRTLTPRHVRLSPSLAKTSSCGTGSVNTSDIRVADPASRQVSQ